MLRRLTDFFHRLRPLKPINQAETWANLFRQRVEDNPNQRAYCQWDSSWGEWRDYTWEKMGEQVAQWRRALEQEQSRGGDRVAILASSSVAWVWMEQAALSLGLVVVPLDLDDTPGNQAFCLADSQARLLLVEDYAHWQALVPLAEQLARLVRVICLNSVPSGADPRVRNVAAWLPDGRCSLAGQIRDPKAIAVLIYGPSESGHPKSIPLTHQDILTEAEIWLEDIAISSTDRFFPLLSPTSPLHLIAGRCASMIAGTLVIYGPSIESLMMAAPGQQGTVLLTTPYGVEQLAEHQGKTVTQPSQPALQTFPPSIQTIWPLVVNWLDQVKRFSWPWKQQQRVVVSTTISLDPHQVASLSNRGMKVLSSPDYLEDRLPVDDRLVLSTGESLYPQAVEDRITHHPLFEQALVVGERRPYLVALLVVNGHQWHQLAHSLGLEPDGGPTLGSPQIQRAVVKTLAQLLADLPRACQIKAVRLKREPFTQGDGLVTAKGKLRRDIILDLYDASLAALYELPIIWK